MLLYETTDAAFADRALAALEAASIPCYKTATSVLSDKYAITAPDDSKVYLFVERQTDYPAANDILVKLGAAVDSPPRLPSVRILLAVAAVAIAFVVFVALRWGSK